MKRLMIRVTDADGNDMFLRHGATPGEGRIVQFPSRALAEQQRKFVEMGLDDGESIAVVPYDAEEE